MIPPATYRIEGPALSATPTLPAAAKALTASSTASVESCTLLLRGLGPGYVEQEEWLPVAGTTPVETSLTWLRLNYVYVVSGDSLTAAGTITITHPITGELARVDAGQPCAWQAVYSIAPTRWTPDTSPDAPPVEEQVDPTKRLLARVKGAGSLVVKHRQHNAPGLTTELHSSDGGQEIPGRPNADFNGDIWVEGDGFVSIDLEVSR